MYDHHRQSLTSLVFVHFHSAKDRRQNLAVPPETRSIGSPVVGTAADMQLSPRWHRSSMPAVREHSISYVVLPSQITKYMVVYSHHFVLRTTLSSRVVWARRTGWPFLPVIGWPYVRTSSQWYDKLLILACQYWQYAHKFHSTPSNPTLQLSLWMWTQRWVPTRRMALMTGCQIS